MSDDEFLLSVPCYCIGQNVPVVEGRTVIGHPATKWATVDLALAIFTDRALAEEYMERANMPGTIVTLPVLRSLLDLLEKYRYPQVALDPNARTGLSRIVPMDQFERDLLAQA